ncbi:hypothetical protein L0128_02840 [candidate division KSB1 bacterium]|nr:hypothetical protein [candidate division KSB1 bacterium]
MSKRLELPLQIIYDQPCFTIQTDQVFLAVTRIGGHAAPVEFYRDSPHSVMPYHIAPWWDEGLTADQPPLLHVLRGDFFCCPFGGNDTPYAGIQYPPHGESANRPWTLQRWDVNASGAYLHLVQEQILRAGTIEKKLALVPGQNVVYSQHILNGLEGPINPGHHANLRFPDVSRSGHLAFSPFTHAQVYVQPTEHPEQKGYSCLQPGAIVSDLSYVPTTTGGMTDLTTYPARRGFEDIFIICAERSLEFAWTTVTFPSEGYLWFALKDPQVLVSTLLWMSNGGRHYPPWNGRHVNVMGLEDITAFFHEGIAASANPNSLNQFGIPTTLMTSKNKPLAINYIQGVVQIPPDFDRVAEIKRENEHQLRFISHHQKSVSVACHPDFLKTGRLPNLTLA